MQENRHEEKKIEKMEWVCEEFGQQESEWETSEEEKGGGTGGGGGKAPPPLTEKDFCC